MINLKLIGEKDEIFVPDNFPRVFEFNEDVARAFDDMASRSIPLYREVNESMVLWAHMLKGPRRVIYDLGCSTGTALLALGHSLKEPAHLIGVDASQAMIEQAKLKLTDLPNHHALTLHCAEAQNVAIEKASMVILNYTLQFIPMENRLDLLKRIYQNLDARGILFFSEKVRFNSPQVQASINWVYDTFKRSTGYSASEIARKKQALEQVLVPLTLDEHMQMLKAAGFSEIQTLLQWNNFVSILAIK